VALVLSACESLKLPGSGKPKEMPGARTGFLAAKVAAFRHAMENMPPEEKRYGEEFYIASGIHDGDAAHVRVLLQTLADMHPPVVEASRLYARDENSRWLDGKPAIAWTSKVQRVDDDSHVFIMVGWMHSNLIYQFYEYETRYLKKEDAWEVVDYKSIDKAGW
jgi:hypothetical protein